MLKILLLYFSELKIFKQLMRFKTESVHKDLDEKFDFIYKIVLLRVIKIIRKRVDHLLS